MCPNIQCDEYYKFFLKTKQGSQTVRVSTWDLPPSGSDKMQWKKTDQRDWNSMAWAARSPQIVNNCC